MNRWRWRAAFWGACVYVLVMALLPHPPRIPGDPDDKVLHIIAFLTLGALGRMAFSGASIWALVVGLSLFGAAIELLQAIPALNRDSDPVDWIADTLAVVVVLGLMRLGRGR